MAEILPAVLFGHGNPMNAQMDNSYARRSRRKRSTGRKAFRKSSRRYDTSILLPWTTLARQSSNPRAPSSQSGAAGGFPSPARHSSLHRANHALLPLSVVIMAVGVGIPNSPLGSYLGFTPIPLLYWPLLALSLLCYAVLTQSVKMWLLRKAWI